MVFLSVSNTCIKIFCHPAKQIPLQRDRQEQLKITIREIWTKINGLPLSGQAFYSRIAFSAGHPALLCKTLLAGLPAEALALPKPSAKRRSAKAGIV
ncbi:MAG: hypothetical protein COZ64_02745 [Candidatus Brennerbacteria bacterium CG_4_8_14_3_um_filter_43_14]|uniref:Uncharacterized protein n=1 Tax=Candidatus Brennerbacteria bacterium CG_4_8_14_3_um_filter_43_14 TaxID=1974521 RepID=A0A2H9N3U4_9BACT|nr:MAG: hypothetical protein COZ64_02745 [Candidatus Brennerbacteria bacterium CG_4_8_14_3_um_filter_43_14]